MVNLKKKHFFIYLLILKNNLKLTVQLQEVVTKIAVSDSALAYLDDNVYFKHLKIRHKNYI